jgi:hypothetical protein
MATAHCVWRNGSQCARESDWQLPRCAKKNRCNTHTHTQRDWLTDARNPVSLFRMIRSFTITWMFATVDIYLILSIRSLTCQMTWPVLSSHNRHLLVFLSLSLCLSVCASLVIWQQNVKKWNWRLLGSKVQPFLSSSRTCVSKKETLVWRWVNDCFPCLLGFSLSPSPLSLSFASSFLPAHAERKCVWVAFSGFAFPDQYSTCDVIELRQRA